MLHIRHRLLRGATSPPGRFMRSRIIPALLLAVFLSSMVFSQSATTGDIAGTVTDPSAAVIPNATVTLKGTDTGSTQTTTTNQSGYYRFSQLKPGRYSVTVSQAGFQK